MAATFELEVSYQQLAVFDPGLTNPFNDWNERHVAQGFAWRPGSVSFRTISDGPMSITVARDWSGPHSSAVRVIRVPFEVSASDQIEVASIASSQVLKLPSGTYDLYFECGASPEGAWCNLVFAPQQGESAAAVIRADSELNPQLPLLMEAAPA